MEDNLWKLIQAIEISRSGVALIKQNYAIVAVMNTAALLLALPGGLISPQMTAVLSNGSAIVEPERHPSYSPLLSYGRGSVSARIVA